MLGVTLIGVPLLGVTAWAAAGWVLAGALLVVLTVLLVRTRRWHAELRRVRDQIAARSRRGSVEPLELALGDRELDALVALFDTQLAAERRETVAGRGREERLRGQIADISHDLKTPLIAVKGYLQLLARDGMGGAAGEPDGPGRDRERLEIVNRRVDDLSRLLDDFFELSVLDAPGEAVDLAPVDATALVGEVLVGFHTSFETAGVEPEVSLPGHPVMVLADETSLARMVRNLVANALSYTTGGVWIGLTEVPGDPTDGEAGQEAGRTGRVRLTVRNDAAGMTPQAAGRLFERYYRADSARTGPHAGLGLAIVRALARQMGGGATARLDGGMLSIEVLLDRAG